MNLAFKEEFKNGTPTYFIDRIWNGLHRLFGFRGKIFAQWSEYAEQYHEKFNREYDVDENSSINKITTIRADEKNRWKAGNVIHFIINNRTKDRFQFAPIMEVKSTQKFIITILKPNEHTVFVDHKLIGIYYADTKKVFHNSYYSATIEQIARNDGFESVHDFFKWFSGEFKGKIIHWTDLQY